MRSFLKTFSALFLGLFFVLFATEESQAALKIPVVDIQSRVAIKDADDVLGFTRLSDGWVISGTNSKNQSWVSRINQDGDQLWRTFPLDDANAGEGFITALGVDSQGILLGGISQNALNASGETSPAPSASPSPSLIPSVNPSASTTSARNIPLVNPDNVTPRSPFPVRKDLANLFLIRLDSNGKILNVINSINDSMFLPNSIVSIKNQILLVGNEQVGEGRVRGSVYKYSDGSFMQSYSYGNSDTTFSQSMAISSQSLVIIGSSSETLANRSAVGPSDGIILTISTSSGKITKIIRSSAVGAGRSWNSVSGNLLVSGSSQSNSSKESVITSFTPTGKVSWTSKFKKSDAVLTSENCVALSLFGSSAGLPFTTKVPEIFLYSIDSKGKILKGVRLPSQALISLTTSPGKAKGCALLTYSSAAGARVSFL